jgi:ATP-binding cassette subfamily C protein
MFSTLRKLFYLFDQRTRTQIFFLFGLMVLSAILETGGVGLIVPFITVIADPGIIESNRWLHKTKEVIGAATPTDFLIFMSIGLVAFYIVKNSCLSVMNYLQLRFVFSKRSSLGNKLFRSYLESPYTFHLERNTAELYRNIDFAVTRVYGFVLSLLKLCTELCVLTGIVILLLFVNPIIVICSVSILGAVSGIFYKVISRYSLIFGEKVQSSQKYVAQSVLEGFGAIKEVKVSGRESLFSDRYYSNMMDNARANWMHSTLNVMPRLFLEVVAIGSVILIVILLQVQGKEIRTLLPTLGLFAMATIRLMPSLSQIVSNLQQIRFYSPSVDLVYQDIHHFDAVSSCAPQLKELLREELSFEREIRVENLDYAYPSANKMALRGVSLKIHKGQVVAFVGSSGAGKTTLANVILGLLEPTGGRIYVDKKDIFQNLAQWHRNIGYVPQSIFLLDTNVRNNVAFGLEHEEIDDSKVWDALKVGQLESFVRHLPEGLNTFIGENGVRLSGGQRQRLGIARALYHQPEILILDEATSALDSEIEKEVSRAIEELSGQKTLIIIAHRLSTIRQCDNIYFMQKGSIVDSGTFDELVAKNPEFKRMAKSGKLEV